MNASAFYRTEPTGSQAYGAPRDGGSRTHTGDDFSHSTRPDTIDVPAIRAGVVVGIQRDSPTLGNGYGNQVTVRHDDGSRFSYSHLGRIGVWNGQRVEVGTIVGTEGTTGWTDGPCVHVEFFDTKGRRQDPYPHIREALAQPAAIHQEEDMALTPEQAKAFEKLTADVAQMKAVMDAMIRNNYDHLLDAGDLRTILDRLDTLQGAPHPTRNDYGRVLDAGDLREILNAIEAQGSRT